MSLLFAALIEKTAAEVEDAAFLGGWGDSTRARRGWDNARE